MYLGRYKEAVALLEAATASGGRAQDPGDAAPEYLALAEAYEGSGRRTPAIRAAGRAIELSHQESVLFPAALVLIRNGQPDKAHKVAETLHGMLQAQTSSFARLIDGEIALTRKHLGEAVGSLREGQKRYDSWFAHFLLGRAYLDAKYFPEALSEFELCVKRKGEAMDVFFLDASTIRYLPPALYWLGRAQEGVGALDAARKSYEQFLALRPGIETSDPLVADARKRAGQPGEK
jgi:tetratricopeptide (TPR) repeat protein